VAQSFDQKIYVWDSPGVFDPQNQPWPLFHHDSRRTGEVNNVVWVPVGLPDGAGNVGPALAASYPNPFRARTTLSFTLDEGHTESVSLSVYDVRGRLIRTLHDAPAGAGEYSFTWDGADQAGRRLGAGIYFYRLRTSQGAFTRKLVLLP